MGIDKTGVIITNTGTPDAPTPEAIRSYLAEFLSDPYVISCPPIIWERVLKHSILPKRPEKSAPRYRAIWTPEGSPFLLTSLEQRDALARELQERGYDIAVMLGMRYGNPSLAFALEGLAAAGCTRIIALPLYPQQARVTTQTTLDRIETLCTENALPFSVRAISSYFDNSAYIAALAASVHEIHPVFASGDRLLMTFHSTVLRDIKDGDPYRDQIEVTCALLAQSLGLVREQWETGYQCRFDSRKWLKPTPEEVLVRWAKQGIKNVTVVCPGFASDCIETLVDCDVEQRELFGHETGNDACFTYVPCLNARNDHIAALADVVEGVFK